MPFATHAVRILFLTFCLAAIVLPVAAEPKDEAASKSTEVTEVDFATQVKPILSDKCFFCHGPDANHRSADLRLDLPPESSDDNWAIAAGDREESLAWERINDSDDPMPPVKSHKVLSAKEIDILGRWIDQGAPYLTHWAYAPIEQREAPAVSDDGWSRGKIDKFVLDKMQRQRLKPSPQAAPAKLLRRLYLDLIGLPPSPAEVKAFLADPSDDAYQQVVDRLLNDPRFGEHWAAWWLDLVRYADSVGFHGDQPRSVWAYRDWVVSALNAGMPFDEFTRLQLAGDLLEVEGELAEEKQQRLFASAYNRLGPVTAEGGAQQGEYRAIYAADRVANFGEVWLGSSTGCARCHDHKYDPFTASDFYSLAAVFEDIDHPLVCNGGANPHWSPYMFCPQDEEQAKLVAEVEDEYNNILSEHSEAGPYQTWTVSRDAGPAPPAGPWADRIKELFKQRNELAKTVPVALYTRTLPEPRTVKLLPRGNWMDESGPVMQARPPAFLGGESPEAGRFNRLDLANWLFEPDNPLPARVVVNRLWERFFGRGISSNTLDVGNQGEPPTHVELIDWMATEFRQNDWDLRHMMRAMVMSNTYRQSASQTPELVQADPDNKWFARQSAPRLSAEVLRDQALAVSGLLVEQLGGPGVFPYQPDRHWDALNFPKRQYKQSHGDDLYRRSVYSWVQRSFPHPAMTVFDAPNRESCTAERSESNTPLQALTVLNETLNVEAARKLAERVMLEHAEYDQRIAAMFELVLLRRPTEEESVTLRSLHDSQQAHYSAHPSDAEAVCKVGESKPAASIAYEELAAYASIARVVLNLHETLTRS